MLTQYNQVTEKGRVYSVWNGSGEFSQNNWYVNSILTSENNFTRMREISLVSPLKVSTIWTVITQDSLTKAKQGWEICSLKYLKVGKWEQKGEIGREKGSDEP